MANIATKSAIFFGRIMTPDLPNFVKVAIEKYAMDQRLLMYFSEKTEVYAYDKKKECNEGDFVIIKEVPEPDILYAPGGIKVKYHIDKLVYKLGYRIDPLTGKQCVGTEYLDDIKRKAELFNFKSPFVNYGKKSETME